MNIDINLKVKARFRCVAHKGDPSEPTRSTGWFDNLVLDSGLNRMKTGDWINRISVGTGNSTPVATQTSLDAYRSATSSMSSNWAVSRKTDESSRVYTSIVGTYRYSSGAASGNISELGLAWTDSNIWNRALVRNSAGIPTTITVLSDEYLDVQVEVRIYRNILSTGTIDIKDGIGDIVSSVGYRIIPSAYSLSYASFGQVSLYGGNVFSGEYDGGLNYPSGALGSSNNTTSLTNTDPHKTTGRVSFELTQANGSWKSVFIGINGFGANVSSYWYGFAVIFDTPVVKLNTERITMTLTVSWGRDTGG